MNFTIGNGGVMDVGTSSDLISATQKFWDFRKDCNSNVKWEYFKAYEVKNLSDALGSRIKAKCMHKMLDHPDWVRSTRNIINLLSDMLDTTEKFTFIIVEEFKEFGGISAKEWLYSYKNILKIHGIKTLPSGILVQHETCTFCSPFFKWWLS